MLLAKFSCSASSRVMGNPEVTDEKATYSGLIFWRSLGLGRGLRKPAVRNQDLAVTNLDGRRVARRAQTLVLSKASVAQRLVIQAAHGQVDCSSCHPARLVGSHEGRHVSH